jgi:creatinine amidohydrolase
MDTLLLEEMTWSQIGRAMDEGYRTVIVCAGAIEQHGKHLPLGMDTMDGYVIGAEIAKELGNTLVAPVIRPGCSDHHLAFPGSLSIPPELLQELCRTYCRNLSHHGFEQIALICSHGGNIQAMEAVAPEIDAELPCKVAWANILRDPRGDEALVPILDRYRVTGEEGGIHSGFVETSILLATGHAPLVDMAAAERGFVGDARTRVAELQAEGSWDIADLSPIGVLGDPTKASVEAGQEILAALVPVYAQVVREALGM